MSTYSNEITITLRNKLLPLMQSVAKSVAALEPYSYNSVELNSLKRQFNYYSMLYDFLYEYTLGDEEIDNDKLINIVRLIEVPEVERKVQMSMIPPVVPPPPPPPPSITSEYRLYIDGELVTSDTTITTNTTIDLTIVYNTSRVITTGRGLLVLTSLNQTITNADFTVFIQNQYIPVSLTGTYLTIFARALENGVYLDAGATFTIPIGGPIYLLDKDLNPYTTVTIGNQEWIVENLRTTTYSDGESIQDINGDWETLDGAYTYYGDDKVAYEVPYGALYNWHAVNSAHGLAYFTRSGIQEEGWRVPSNDDWLELIDYLGGTLVSPGIYNIGGDLKQRGTNYWNSPNTGATNNSGLAALGAGIFVSTPYPGYFEDLNIITHFWSKTVGSTPEVAPTLDLWFNLANLGLRETTKSAGLSVRCVRGGLPLPAPLALDATDITNSSFVANWSSDYEHVKGYYLDIATDIVFATYLSIYQNLDMGMSTSISVTGLSIGTTYYYRLRLYTDNRVSINSNIIGVTTLAFLEAPVALPATDITFTTATANWLGVTYAEGYYLELSETVDFASKITYTIGDGATLFQDLTTLTQDTTYFYRLQAYNAVYTSVYSNIIDFTTLVPYEGLGALYNWYAATNTTLVVPPDAPVAIAPTSISQRSFTTNWIVSENATGYYLDVAYDSNFTMPFSVYDHYDVGNVLSFNISGYDIGTPFSYRVTAYNIGGESIHSNVWISTTLSVGGGYGLLYNRYAATYNVGGASIMPAGWHVSNTSDWNNLIAFVGGAATGADKLKESGSTYWTPNNLGTNDYGFNARGSGYRSYNYGTFTGFMFAALFLYVPVLGGRFLQSNQSNIFNAGVTYEEGASLRGVKDSTSLTDGQVSTVTDIDGNVYPTVCINGLEWMAENLKVTHYNNGVVIPEVTFNSTWHTLTTGALCVYDNNWANI